MTSRVDVSLHAGPSVGFDQPFEMLAACHERVRRSLDLLQRLHTHVAQQGVDAQARDAARDVMRYFDVAGPAHHEDEERHVLPRLRDAGQSALAERLQADHAEMTRLWGQLRVGLAAWASGGDAALDATVLQRYVDLYADHLAVEDEQAFVVARQRADAADCAAMGQEMAARRSR
jgi:hemerythrin-like domain-containing protein